MAKAKAVQLDPPDSPFPVDGCRLVGDAKFVFPGWFDSIEDADLEDQYREAARHAVELRDSCEAYIERLGNYPRDPREAVAFGVETRMRRLDLYRMEANCREEVAALCERLERASDAIYAECAAETRREREEATAQLRALGVGDIPIRQACRDNVVIQSLQKREQYALRFVKNYADCARKHRNAAGWCRDAIEAAAKEIAHGSIHDAIVSASQAADFVREHTGKEYRP